MACPYFIPTEKIELGWQHPHRLPLGAGWTGVCGAPGQGRPQPTDEELRDCCNLGHAACCRKPEDRAADAVRFLAKSMPESRVTVSYVFERDCLPAGGGQFDYDLQTERWLQRIPDETLQRQAECFLATWRSYRERVNPLP